MDWIISTGMWVYETPACATAIFLEYTEYWLLHEWIFALVIGSYIET